MLRSLSSGWWWGWWVAVAAGRWLQCCAQLQGPGQGAKTGAKGDSGQHTGLGSDVARPGAGVWRAMVGLTTGASLRTRPEYSRTAASTELRVGLATVQPRQPEQLLRPGRAALLLRSLRWSWRLVRMRGTHGAGTAGTAAVVATINRARQRRQRWQHSWLALPPPGHIVVSGHVSRPLAARTP